MRLAFANFAAETFTEENSERVRVGGDSGV
jgi:hypothetical protein